MRIHDLRKTIGVRLRQLRLERGWTQAEVAKRTGITSDFLGRAERGRREPSLWILSKLAAVFSVEPLFLLSRDDVKANPLVRELETIIRARTDQELRWLAYLVRGLVDYPGPDGGDLVGRQRPRRRIVKSPGRVDGRSRRTSRGSSPKG